MLLLVNETTRDFAITRDGSKLVIKRNAKDETGVSINVAGLDEQLDALYSAKQVVKATACRSTKLFLTKKEHVTVYEPMVNGDTACSAIPTPDYKNRIHSREVLARALVVFINSKDASVPTIVNDAEHKVILQTIKTVFLDGDENGTGFAISMAYIIPANWADISYKKVYIQISVDTKLHISYVTAPKGGKKTNINALIRCNNDGEPLSTIEQEPVKPRTFKKKPYKKAAENGNDKEGKKPYSKPKVYNGDRKPNNKCDKSASGKPNWKQQLNNIKHDVIKTKKNAYKK